MVSVEFYVQGVPISAQAKKNSKNKWKSTVAGAARSSVTEILPDRRRLEVKLVHYYVGGYIDLDNLAKLFLDALKGIVYADDGLIDSLHLVRKDLSSTSFPDLSTELATILDKRIDFVHVCVTELK